MPVHVVVEVIVPRVWEIANLVHVRVVVTHLPPLWWFVRPEARCPAVGVKGVQGRRSCAKARLTRKPL
jgi:hypothetical protein